MKKYWVAQNKGCDFKRLKSLGFITYYPVVDDYVFLYFHEDNEKWLKKARSLKIEFLRQGGEIATISEEERAAFLGDGEINLSTGDRIKVVEGIYGDMIGVIKEKRESVVVCELEGYKERYEAELPTTSVMPFTPSPEDSE